MEMAMIAAVNSLMITLRIHSGFRPELSESDCS